MARGVDEFDKAGVRKAACIEAPGPRVAQSPAQFESRYMQTTRVKGNSAHGWVDVVFGEVARIHLKDEVILPSGKLDILGIRPLARLAYYDYTSVTDIFEMRIPGASEAAAQGREGKA